jgi:hypothetical protein
MSPRPDTYDPWQFIQWVLEQGDDYYVKIPWKDPDTGVTALAYVALPSLPADQWVYWVKRWFVDRSTQVKTAAEWSIEESSEPE